MNKEELITKLIKEGKITFCEALILNTSEKEYVHLPSYQPATVQPYIDFTYRPENQPFYQGGTQYPQYYTIPGTYCTSTGTNVDAFFAYKK